MPQIEKSALVMYSSQEMFDLVNDVDSYPEFLPHCSDAKIFSSQVDEMRAGLEISKAGLKKWFTTHNKLDKSNHSIALELVDGPFKHLHGRWQFMALDEHACKVSLKLEFEFASKLVEMAFGKVFNEVAKNMVQAFTQRAKVVYGER
ncbi:type II toxin-antitoxin system RatA family toxin [Pseudoalteromonas sp. GB56]